MELLSKILNKILRGKKTKETPLFFTKDIYAHKKYSIGDYTYGKPTVLFENDTANLIIGKYCSIANGVKIFLGGNHRTDWISTYPFNVLNKNFSKAKNIKGHPATKGSVIIGNDVWIGNDVTIMSGISIGDGAIVAARAVVTKNIKPYEIWAGNPAKLIRKRFSEKQIEKMLELQWWNWSEEEINNNVDLLCSDINKIDFLKKDR